MRNKGILFYFLCLIFLSGCRQTSAQVVEEKFSVIEGEFENGDKILGSMNMAYKDYGQKADYPWCLQINIALSEDSLFENKLPFRGESTLAYTIEDDLLAGLKETGTIHFLGHLFNDGFLDIYVYLKDVEKANQYLQRKVNEKNHVRDYMFTIQEDSQWKMVSAYLK